jgi:hypothetical protein
MHPANTLADPPLTTEAGEEATQYRNVVAASFVFFVLACVRTLITTWAPLGSIHKVIAYLGAQVVIGSNVRPAKCAKCLRSDGLNLTHPQVKGDRLFIHKGTP